MFFRRRKKQPKPATVVCCSAFNEYPPSIHITTDYADNKIFSQELHVSLSHSDWCEFVKQDFYSQLVEWVGHLENDEISHDIEKYYSDAGGVSAAGQIKAAAEMVGKMGLKCVPDFVIHQK